MDITVCCKEMEVDTLGYKMSCKLKDVELEEIVSECGETKLVEHIGVEGILASMDEDFFLDEIGVEYVKKYFNLREA